MTSILLHDASILQSYRSKFLYCISLLNKIIQLPDFAEQVNIFAYDWKNVILPKDFHCEMSVYNYLFNRYCQYYMKVVVRKRISRFGRFDRRIKGITVLNTNQTVVYDHWLKTSSPQNEKELLNNLTAHLAHEYCHQCGFSDGKNYRQDDVVPYVIGDLVYEFAEEITQEPGSSV